MQIGTGFKAMVLMMLTAMTGAVAGILGFDSVRAFLMEPNGISVNDIALYPKLSKPDVFRLSRIDQILRAPFSLESVVAEVLARSADDSLQPNLPRCPDSLWPLLDIAIPTSMALPFQPEATLKSIKSGLALHTAALTGDEKKFLFREASGLFLQEVEDTARGAVEGEVARLREDARLRYLMDLVAKLDSQGLVSAASAAWQLEIWIIQSIRNLGIGPTVSKLQQATGNDSNFSVHMGTGKADRHRADKGIWIDPGGDDEYQLSGSKQPASFLLIVDLAGDDLYLSKDSLAESAGNMGIHLLVDLTGNDRYLGKNFAFGSALFGYASVFDAMGQDTYEGRCASLGFGFFGLGIVQDQAGNDIYSASLMSQGVGSTKGIGLLLDRSGNDQYLARPTFQDDLRYTDHHIHMVQGFATGFAPNYSGGIGLLRDGSGNDFYLADIFGQGSGYWYALGLLIDEAGEDRYVAHQYSQGAGVHIAIGALLDFAGNDQRAAKGVSQGCGHDLGFGYLYDRGGDDHYLATDMSQGAGSANGLGILYDVEGKDIYESINLEMALGHADMRRDRGSFGFFLDGAGMDRYRLPHRDSSAWQVFNAKTKGNGFGLDR